MLGEQQGVDGVVVKQLVPRGSADRNGRVSVRLWIFLRACAHVLCLYSSKACDMFLCTAHHVNELCTVCTCTDLSSYPLLLLFFSLCFLVPPGPDRIIESHCTQAFTASHICSFSLVPLSHRSCIRSSSLIWLCLPCTTQIKVGDQLLRVGDVDVTGQSVSDLRHLVIGEIGTICAITLKTQITGHTLTVDLVCYLSLSLARIERFAYTTWR